MDLTPYQGQRIEIEIDGNRCCGRVIRGPSRQLVFLEERGNVAQRSDMHQKLGMCRILKPRDLHNASLVGVLCEEEPCPTTTNRNRKRPWNEVVAVAEGDPATPPRDWRDGMLAWAEAVHAARRKVDRSRKAMMQALRESAS